MRVENHWRGDKVSFIGLTVFVEGVLERGGTATVLWGLLVGTLIS